ncbi:hypothetical protein OTU49_014768 [Cherax quadricarinatus]|uniref:Basement membrane-specific heparan sulfate proteoglycan core protein n=1 Tax=Cherax quadricarinatus TaxID=27406 RepID=A0AAW0Y0U8_CHEQU
MQAVWVWVGGAALLLSTLTPGILSQRRFFIAPCRTDQFRCDNGQCIDNFRRCDTAIDCPFGEDEADCQCQPGQFTCDDRTCIDISLRCDGLVQCRDQSDEKDCRCENEEWTCSDGTCIPNEQQCDGVRQCRDGSDEDNCLRVCDFDEWRCREGLCIPQQERCDGRNDCPDYSDEEGCPRACTSGEWTCKDGSCIPKEMLCDGRLDCPDNSDEDSCPITCASGEWTCGDGTCVKEQARCNGAYECPDYTDEEACPEWTCTDGSTIPQQAHCDGRYDCRDYSDEENCPPAPHMCSPPESFLCSNGYCIRADQRCDGTTDCQDTSDEKDCPPIVCSSDQFRCDDGQCVDLRLRCNGVEECSRGEDERGCQCRPDEFRCVVDGSCINQQKRCDHQIDCSDNSDEQGCPPQTPVSSCLSNQFECRNGKCIPRTYLCDGVPDCEDGYDESDSQCASSPTQCSSNQFACNNGECVDIVQRCDSKFDCVDNSDEIGCPAGSAGGTCTENEFRCLDGACIEKTWQCDSVPDCGDASDETNCSCRANEFRCGNGLCIPESQRCDGKYDCRDGSDERLLCDCRQDEFQCGNGACIPSSQRCNGYAECDDNSDEQNCNCGSVQWQCETGECIFRTEVCNGVRECSDGSDERDCPARCTSNEFLCLSGECISSRAVCDRRRDCFDGSDESVENCDTSCQLYEFQCLDGQCISLNAKCDGVADCREGSDETDCPMDATLTNAFQCYNGQYIDNSRRCDGRSDCSDGSDEDRCETDSLSLKTYPDDQSIQQSREVVFQCRDEGTIRAPVVWVRDGNRPLPPGTTDIRGRLTMPNIQVEHSGTYFCEAQGVSLTTPGRRKSVYLQVTPYVVPTPIPQPPACGFSKATCMNGQCIDKDKVCDGNFDCSDASDEMRCNPLGCEPNEFQCDNKRCVLKTWLCDSDDDCGDGSDERDCVTNPPGSFCRYNEFTCHHGNQCIPKSFHCDGDVDCQDGTDELGCSRPIIIEPPPRNKLVQVSETFTLTCLAIGVPMPTVIWRLNWGHVPNKCEMTSVEGRGTLVCPRAQPTDQGAYSCEAINSRGSVFAQPDSIVQVKGGSPVCQPPQFNEGAVTPQDCLTCFCFGATDQCYSTDRYITQLPPPASESFSLVGVNQDQFQGNYVIRASQYPLSSRYLIPQSANVVQLTVDRTKLGGPSDLLVYYSLPDSHKGQQLSAYGGYLRYKIKYSSIGAGQAISGPDVIIMGNNITLMHVHDGTFHPNHENQVDVKFQTGQWFKRVVGRGQAIKSQELANREEIMMVLENMELLLIRALYNDGLFVNVTLSDVQLDTTVISSSNQGRAVLVEECRCPQGYLGLSCQDCAPNYRRVQQGPWLGRCVPDLECSAMEYGDPANGIPCLPCSCPLTSPNNQFGTSCYLANDGLVTCSCRQGYQGRRCELCASGYEGNPTIPGGSCRPAGECDPAGSHFIRADPNTGLCHCKEFVTGPKCDQCKPDSFYLNENNRDGCIECFCMGITRQCTSSNWYRQQESVSFTNDRQGFELVDKFQQTVISNDIFVDSGRQELVFREFSRVDQEVYYWKLPQRFLGNKISSYGGNLTYSLRYVPAPGGQSSANTACAVEIYGNDITLKHYSKSQLSATRQETVSVPLYEQYWERQDGQEANREHFLMALADLEYILIKATYTTNSREVGIKEVILDYAEPRNTGQVRALAVEMCECPQGYQGLSCEDCDIGYTRSLSGLHLGTCRPCGCNGHSEECDPENGMCTNCRDNTAGFSCEECLPGFYKADGRCYRQDGGEPDCNCDMRGSVSCENGICRCKDTVHGESCDTCRPGFFHLSSANQYGCLQCWCSDVSSNCFSSNYYRTQLPMQLLTDHGFTFSNRLQTNVIRDRFSINVANNEISFADFANLRDSETYYWSLPQMFTGNRLPSYGGNLTITQRYQAHPAGNTYADPDIIIRSSGGREFIWMMSRPLQQNIEQTYSVVLTEDSFTMNQQPASRSEFLNALSFVDAILIRATLSDRMSATFLRDVIMDTAMPSQTGQPRALEVEQCQCPSEYSGLSCQQCRRGYYRDSATKRCLLCPCNGHEDSCVQLASGNVRCDCLQGYYGPFCRESEPPTVGSSEPTISVTISEPRLQIAALGSTVQFHCSARSLTGQQNRVSVTWSKAGGELPYGRASDNRQGLLIITQVRPLDSGSYICAATDGFGQVVTQNVTLIVEGGPPRVTLEERREVLEVIIGETLEVRCSAEGSPQPQITWTRGQNRELPASVFQQNGVLSFRSAHSSDSGEYYCTARNSQGMDYARIIINVRPPDATRPSAPDEPLIIVQVSSPAVQARSGETVRVRCYPGSPGEGLRIEWNRLTGPLPSQTVIEDGELQIPNARPADSGIYVCRITDERTNSFEESTTHITITPFVNLPMVQIQPDRQTINQGTNAELRCIVSGDPAPVITWSKVNEEFGAGVIVEGSILRINNAVINDRGMYVCTAQNDGGTAQAAAIIEVERREPPVIEVYPEVKQTIVVGASALFQCHLTAGIPNPSVYWTRTDGRPLTSSTETLDGGVLRFNQVQGDEEGSYTCTAENDAGTVRAIAILEIQSLPVITIHPGPSPYMVRIGERVRLECSAQGDPAPSVTWQKLQVNFPSVIPSRSTSPSVAVYEIASVTRADEGTYQCTARNSAGVSEERIQLNIEDVLPGNSVPGIPAPSPARPHDSSTVIVPVGGSYEFTCSGHGPDADSIIYTFQRSDDRPLPAGAYTQNGVLYLTNVDESASGEYACVGADPITGTILFTVYSVFEVLAPPRITLDPARQVVRPGEIVRIRCSATGPSPITINWSKESGRMPPSVIISDGEMMFRGIETSDAGRYICTAINSAGTTRAVAEVIVNEEPLLAAIQQDVVMYVGQTAELRCETSGINPNDVRWSRIGGRLPPGAIARGNLLRLPFIQPEDSGRYQCEALTASGYPRSDVITLTVTRLQTVDIRIRPSRSNVRISEDVELVCEVSGEPAAAVSWSRRNSGLPSNAETQGNVLRLVNVQSDNGGVYRCTVTTPSGVFEESYALVIQDIISTETIHIGHKPRSVETRSAAYGLGVVMECRVSLAPPVSYTWNKQGGKLPVNSAVQDAVLDIPEVHTEDAGLYICTGSNEERSVDIPTLLLVTGIVPRFEGSSYLLLSTLPRAYLSFNLEISFKPESENGLILYNSQRAGREDGDFVSFGMSEGYAEFRFDVGSGPAIIRSRQPLQINQWHTVKLSRDRKEGTMTVDDDAPITGRSEGRFLGLDLLEPLYLGGVPDFTRIHEQAGFASGFRGCISRLVIGSTVAIDLMRAAANKVEISSCETCAGNPCHNNGVCQEAYTEVGHKCICPAGFSGGLCEDTGESCYAGVCGTGRCVNKPGGFECYCPFGKVGQRCEQDITIYEPAFENEAYIAYPTPRALRRFSVDLNFKPENLHDGVLMYCAQKESGEGDFASLAIRNKRLEFRFNTGSGTATIQSDALQQGEWVEVRANRTDRFGSLMINDGPVMNGESPGAHRGLNLVTPLFIGGVDRSRIAVSPEVEVTNGFTGCVSKIKLMDQEIRMAEAFVDSANVGQCGGSSSPCSLNPCRNRGECVDNSSTSRGFICKCQEGYSGQDCEIEPGVCSLAYPCQNGGSCIGSGDHYSCYCPLGFAGRHCERIVDVEGSASFSGDSWVEFNQSLLSQEGGASQKLSLDFTTHKSEGLLFWYGQESNVSGRGQDYISVAINRGYVEFSYELGNGPALVRSSGRVDNGERHTLIVKRTEREGSLQLDTSSPVFGQSPGVLHMLNANGNIYIGGVPDFPLMTAGAHTRGFEGCIHRLIIGDEKVVNFKNLAVSGVNVTPCPRSRVRENTHVTKTFQERHISNGRNVNRRTVFSTKRTVHTSQKNIHG